MADQTADLPSQKKASSARVYESIENTADLYPPGVYDLLTFQRATWQTSDDPLSQDFIPLTDVPGRAPRDAKIFVIGLLPPSANVTGNLLDRSATLQAKGVVSDVVVSNVGLIPPVPAPPAAPPLDDKDAVTPFIVTAPGYQISTPAGNAKIPGVTIKPGAVGDPESAAITTHSAQEMYNIFEESYRRVTGREPTQAELLILVTHSNRETSGRWANNNPGFIGNYGQGGSGRFHANGAKKSGAPQGSTGKYFDSFATTADGADAFLRLTVASQKNPNIRTAAANGDVLGYVTSLAQTGYYGDDQAAHYYGGFARGIKTTAAAITAAGGPAFDTSSLPGEAPQTCPFLQTGAEYRQRNGLVHKQTVETKGPNKGVSPRRFRAESRYGKDCPLPDGDPVAAKAAPSWTASGSDAASKAAKDADKGANKDLNLSQLGQQLRGAQRDYILALQEAIRQMEQTPPLRMLVNPISFKIAEEKGISDGNFGRNGPIVEHWGEQQTKLTASGKLAGFYALDVGASFNGSAGNAPGITRMARNFSQSYQNFLSLYLIYRNNGQIWLQDFSRQFPGANNLALVGSVYIYYDNVLYIGSFDSLNVTEADDKPYTLEYDYSFTVRAKFELDRIPDPQETYGTSEFFATRLPATIPTTTAASVDPVSTFIDLDEESPITDPVILEAKRQQQLAPPKKSEVILPPESSIGLELSAPKPLIGNQEFIPTTFGKPLVPLRNQTQMPRGPFQGTFQSNLLSTVVTGPDAIVYINGETDVIGCPSCRKRFDLNAYITSVSCDLSVESVPGSASISLAIPRHSVDDFYFEGNPLITPMMEVEIFAKGYYLVEGVPQYYPIFWGLVTEVGNSYSGGEHTVTIQCADILKWWELCKMNINPALTMTQGQAGRSIFGNVFFGMNPYDVIWTCAQQSFGDVVVGSGSLISLVKENGAQRQVFTEALGDIMAYWESRFSRVRSNLLLYGTNGIAIRGDSLYEAYNRKNQGVPKKPFASQAVRNANGGKEGGQMVFDPTDKEVVAFRTQFQNAGQVNFFQSEYQTKLELANAAKEAAGFEFFMDVTGDIVFKPPFYNLDVLSNKPVSWIQDIDVIDWDFSESESEVVTQLTMQGSFGGNVDYGMDDMLTPYASVTDYHLLRKYGWRSHSYNSEFMGDTQLMFYHGLDILDRLNSKRHRGTVTIPMRPELRLGFPIYIAPLDQVWYIQGISHNLSFGGRAQTTLTLTAKRQKFFAPRGIGTIELTNYSGVGADKAKDPKPAQGTKNAQGGQQKVEAVAQPKLPFKYTSRQLSKYGTFTVNLGMGAVVPAEAKTLKGLDASQVNPYEPVVLRHPKTGRAIGHPNVNLIYTRPFAPPKDELASKSGQRTSPPKQGNPTKAKTLLKGAREQLEADLQPKNTVQPLDYAHAKLLNNRYQYGLNSAGVFAYVYDKGGQGAAHVFGEVTFIPSKNIKTQFEGQATDDVPLLSGGSGMLRPVSDERGFEVVGHFRYGRGLALRDGSLITNGEGPNKQASVDLQVALSGDLYSTLTAQSQGITTLTSVYSNPVDAISRLAPEDLETAAVPKDLTGGYSNTGKNFVDSAPIGSPEREGVEESVEASQLSRALTIAELNILKDPGSEDSQCSCLTGRSDLAFMNVGYQLKPLNVNTMGGVAPATGNLPGTTIGGSDAIRSATELSIPITDEEYRAALGGQNVSDRINEFLFSLYSALDKPHQEFELALRGELLDLNLPTAEELRFGNGGARETSELSAPFNPANRLAVGDPAAFAAQANSAKADLKKTWTDFSKKLKTVGQQTQLQGQINQAQKELNETEAELNKLKALQEAINSGAKVLQIPGTKSIPDQIKDLEAEKAKLEQQIKDDTKTLSELVADSNKTPLKRSEF